MITQDQSETIEFLGRPEAYGAGGDQVDRVETHISEIFLVGDRAYKLKRAVKFPYLDFSTPMLRRRACEAEVAINRRTAPAIYRGVVAVTRGPGRRLALDGDGEAVDWLVAMLRFDEDTLFDRLAKRGALDESLMEALAETIAHFHAAAERRDAADGAAAIAAIIDGNARSFAECAAGDFDVAELERLDAGAGRALDGCRGLLDARARAGSVRHCHGDLHLRNICLHEDRPTLFDAIEFNEALAVIDVLYDLAFLIMDLEYRDLRGLANITLNRYLDVSGDGGGLGTLPLFLSLRAAIRAHVSAAAADSATKPSAGAGALGEARAYIDLALAFLAPPAPRLIAVGGLSGSGKSLLARRLAPPVGAAPGAWVVRSDVERKRLAGVDPLTRLGPEGYTPEMTRHTYDAVCGEARRALAAGHAVIADAVFARPEERQAIAAVAEEAGVPFDGLWLEAPPGILASRIAGRRRDASDAIPGMLRRQLGYDIGPLTWARVDASGSLRQTEEMARSRLAL